MNILEDETLSTEELADQADDKIDILIDILVEKGVISKGEFQKRYDDLFEGGGSSN